MSLVSLGNSTGASSYDFSATPGLNITEVNFGNNNWGPMVSGNIIGSVIEGQELSGLVNLSGGFSATSP